MFSNAIARLGLGAPAAAVVTFGLFTFMWVVISGYDAPGEADALPELEAITPQKSESEVRSRQRAKPKKLDSADKPPPPPKLRTNKSDIDLPTPQIKGSAPTELRIERVQSLAIDPIAISDRDAQPIRPPIVNYPDRAAQRGTEGSCEVKFNVDTRGKPKDIVATCTSSVFRREAERAVSRVEFAPKIIRGKPAERRNVVYPIDFTLED